MEKWDSERIYLSWRSQRNTLKANWIRRETGQERKCISSAKWEKNLHFLLFIICIARFQALRSSVSLTIRYPVLGHYQSRSFLLVTLFPKEPKKAASFTGKGSTPHFKACRCSVRVIKLCQTKSNLLEILSGIILSLILFCFFSMRTSDHVFCKIHKSGDYSWYGDYWKLDVFFNSCFSSETSCRKITVKICP